MKSHIRPYAEFLIKRNVSFIVMAIVLLLGSAGVILYMHQQVTEMDAKIKTTQAKIDELTAKRTTLRAVIGESTASLDEDLQVMSTIIPDAEDYFSIINALESLSQKTNFRIDSYSINLLASTSNKLSLTVIGTGDNEAFLTFLSKYQLDGGRLITAEHIGIDPSETGGIRLDLNFYNKKASSDIASGSAAAAPSIAELNDIKSKVTFTLTGPSEERPIQDYETKQDPF